jgi:PAS domain-containing protein
MGLSSEITYRQLQELRPDPRNPRLPREVRNSLDGDDLIVHLADQFDALIIAESVSRHGFFGSEPLIVCREDDQWIVLEGNRRLTALLGLARPELCERFADRADWELLRPVQPIEMTTEVPVLVADAREDADAVIGFRHIGGALAWKPLQRAQFIAYLVDERDQGFAEVADTVGDEESTVRMLYRNQSILTSASELGRSDILELGQARFGTYTAALNRTGLREFVGAAPVGEVREKQDQLDAPRLAVLVELFSWLYGIEGEHKVIRESRELSMLAEVVKRPDALAELRRTRDLDAAYALTPAPNQSLARQLGMAVGNLRAAVSSVELLVDDPRTRERAEEMRDLLDRLFSALENGTAEQLED